MLCPVSHVVVPHYRKCTKCMNRLRRRTHSPFRHLPHYPYHIPLTLPQLGASSLRSTQSTWDPSTFGTRQEELVYKEWTSGHRSRRNAQGTTRTQDLISQRGQMHSPGDDHARSRSGDPLRDLDCSSRNPHAHVAAGAQEMSSRHAPSVVSREHLQRNPSFPRQLIVPITRSASRYECDDKE